VGNDLTGLPPAPSADTQDAAHAVTALYREHALGLTRLAFLVLGDRHAAEDVVQDAFCGLYRAWDRLPAHDRALGYVRVSVLNGCRSVLRRARRAPQPAPMPLAAVGRMLREEQ
jgi:DNA-directed RNA polymerase specialized sigma24 family protein